MTGAPVSFAHCRVLARDVRRSPNRRAVLDTLRPRGVTGLFRSRAPIAVQLHLAARDGRLIEKAGMWALLERPQNGSRTTSDSPATRILDVYWDVLLFGLPPLVILPAAVPVAAVAGPTAGLGTVAVAVVWAVLLMALAVVRQLVLFTAGRRRLVGTAVGQLRGRHWTITGLHAPTGVEAAALVDCARQRIALERSAVLVLTEGCTQATPAARGPGGLRIEPLSPRHPVLVGYRRTDPRWELPPGPTTFRRRDVAVILSGTVVFVLLLAGLVARDEARVCGNKCDGLPATYGDALYWLLSRMLGGDPDGLGATSAGNRLIGVLMTVYGVFILVTIIGRVMQQRMDEDARSGPEVVAAFVEERDRRPAATLLRRSTGSGARRRRGVAGRRSAGSA